MTAPFNHAAGEAAIETLRSLPSPTRERVQQIINLRLYPRGDKPLGFEPTQEEMAMAEDIACAIVDMVNAAALAPQEGAAG